MTPQQNAQAIAAVGFNVKAVLDGLLDPSSETYEIYVSDSNEAMVAFEKITKDDFDLGRIAPALVVLLTSASMRMSGVADTLTSKGLKDEANSLRGTTAAISMLLTEFRDRPANWKPEDFNT